MNFTFRPPQIAIMNELGIRRVAPAKPATAGSMKRSALYPGSSYASPPCMNVKLKSSPPEAKWSLWTYVATIPQ